MTLQGRLARLIRGLIALSLILPASLAADQVPGARPDPAAAAGALTLAAFISRGSPPPLPYRAFRRLEARNERTGSEGWVEAMTTFDPVNGFSYQILGEGGSGLIRGRVLKSALETEKRTLNSGGTEATLTDTNYLITHDGTVADAGAADDRLVRLQLKPRRKDPMLMDGFVIVTPSDAEVVRVEGRLSKNPSFWTTRVDIVRRYASVAGYNVPVELESRAQVRLFGASTFRMSFRYEQINGLSIPAGTSEQPIAPAPR